MLVDVSGKIKLYGFETSYLRENSKSNSISPVTRDEHRAPECFRIAGNGQLDGINHSPTFKSDVYSFGIAILETFEVWPFDRANGVLRNLISLKKNPTLDKLKPETMSDKTWNLIKSMLERDQHARAPLSMVIEELRDLAQEEAELRKSN